MESPKTTRNGEASELTFEQHAEEEHQIFLISNKS